MIQVGCKLPSAYGYKIAGIELTRRTEHAGNGRNSLSDG